MPDRFPPSLLPSFWIGIADADTLGDALVERVVRAARGGLVWALLRAKGWERGQRIEAAREIGHRAPGLTLSIHSDREAMEATGCGGVHWPSGPLPSFRGGAERERLVGVSCHDEEELDRAARDGADYVFLSPVFPPTSKPASGPVLGVDGFGALASRSEVPVFALGGMKPERVGEVAGAGASGVAVLGDLFLADDVEARARQWAKAVGTDFDSDTARN